MSLTPDEMNRVIALRRALHQEPELSGDESATARSVLDFLTACRPSEVLRGIGGEGIAAMFSGVAPGPTVAFRAELDGVPVAETSGRDHGSRTPGRSHACGHDGHAAILAGMGLLLARRPPARGRVVLLFQPAEETGEGAALVVADPKFKRIAPDWIFALHNLPGYPRGQVITRPGVFACASTGMAIRLNGETSHAAHPEQARCPALAMAAIIPGLIALPRRFDFFSLVTVVHARLGEVTFGTTPGEAEIMATLRAAGDERLQALLAAARKIAEEHAAPEKLTVSIDHCDPFPALVNDPEAVEFIRAAVRKSGGDLHDPPEPFRWSDDFGRFTAVAKGAMFGLGAGGAHAPLHSPIYDFPDDLIDYGVGLFDRILRQVSVMSYPEG
jgi:amidohydrolase